MSDIHVGDTLTLFNTFYDGPESDPGRTPGDPEFVTLTVQKPSGDVDVYTDFTHIGDSGYYEHVIEVDESGFWRGHWLGTGGILTSEMEPFGFKVEKDLVGEPVGS